VLAEWGSRIHSPNSRCLMIIAHIAQVLAGHLDLLTLKGEKQNILFYSKYFLGKVHNSFKVLNGANHTLETFIILQSSEGVQATS